HNRPRGSQTNRPESAIPPTAPAAAATGVGLRGARRGVAARLAAAELLAVAVAAIYSLPGRVSLSGRGLPASASLIAARRRAELDRGFRSISASAGLTARLVTSSASGSWPQTHTGISGGQTQPRARSAK